ncbi:MAG: hypothetical protein P0S95_04500 [Rhabdochlamydiaceae bacterium]|nr:hypothetical protein [Candidatus Amphrikana amoebophyrae]
MKIKWLLILLTIPYISLIASDPVCYFSPPKKWIVADQSKNAKKSKIAYIDKKLNAIFYPSISLNIYECKIPPKEYIEANIAANNKDRNQTCFSLGPIETQAGQGELIQIEHNHSIGKITILQTLLFKDSKVYILTGSALSKEISKYYDNYLTSFRSLNITPSFFDLMKSSPASRDHIKLAFEEILLILEKAKQPLNNATVALVNKKRRIIERFLETDCSHFGTYLPILALEELKRKIQLETQL